MRKSCSAAGRLIVFEGPDGVGKSTVSREVLRELLNRGVACELLTFPGREEATLGRLVYQIHHEPEALGLGAITTTGRQALHIAAHLDAIERRILPALGRGVTVLLDRYWWSTWVYGLVGGMNPHVLQAMVRLEAAQWGHVRPTLAVLLRRDEPIDRDEPRAHWQQLRDSYDRLTEQERARHPVLVVDSAETVNAAVASVLTALHDLAPELVSELHPLQPIKTAEARGASREKVPSSPSFPVEVVEREDEPAARQAAQLSLDLTARGEVSSPEAPFTLKHLLPVKPTLVYDTYWRFAAERQRIFFQRVAGAPPPWTSDPVLRAYKFTNAYRASDRTSQYLIRRVIYREDLPTDTDEVFFRIMLFKLFNKIETWELLEAAVGQIGLATYSFDAYDAVLTQAMASGTAIYSAAYIMPPAGSFGHVQKHRNHLALIERMLADELPARLGDATSLQKGFELLRAYPGIGDFLAYQYVTDLNYSTLTEFSEMEFVVPGPGARDGIAKCFADQGGLNEPEIIRFMADRQEREFERLELDFRTLWGRRLQLIDCQNLFCEVDKYSRVRHPEVVGRSKRTRIKQRFAPTGRSYRVWYPPKWGLNARIEADRGSATIATSMNMPAQGAE